MERVLFVTSEYYPLIKTGGLADASAGLTGALRQQGVDVKILIPGYPQVLARLENQRVIAHIKVDVGILKTIELIEGNVSKTDQTVWAVNCPEYFDRPGGPYLSDAKTDWPDNYRRFALFCRVAEDLALGRTLSHWIPTVVHCNDWHAGLTPAFLSTHKSGPVVVTTIHNLAYQGVFGYEAFENLKLPSEWWSFDKLEFYGNFSFLKASIVFSDFIITVSPNYAKEILTPEYGYGLDRALTYHQHRLKGILNGIDYNLWNPSSDPYIYQTYNQQTIDFKSINKAKFQSEVGLTKVISTPLIGVISRLVDQKGMDLLPSIIQKTIDKTDDIQWAILGTGEDFIEAALTALATKYPDRVSVRIGYDEPMAHKIEAASDFFLMPSRYEPCGLNQVYSLKYGTLPIVRNTGGLADTVVDASIDNIKNGTATGIQFEECSVSAIVRALDRASLVYKDKEVLLKLRCNAMKQSFSWDQGAQDYLSIYQYMRRKKH